MAFLCLVGSLQLDKLPPSAWPCGLRWNIVPEVTWPDRGLDNRVGVSSVFTDMVFALSFPLLLRFLRSAPCLACSCSSRTSQGPQPSLTLERPFLPTLPAHVHTCFFTGLCSMVHVSIAIALFPLCLVAVMGSDLCPVVLHMGFSACAHHLVELVSGLWMKF